MGFGLSEKAAYVALFAPIGLVMLWKARRTWLRIAMPAAAVAVFALAVLPYLRYSEWESFTPYGGDDRLYVASGTPFAGGTEGFAETTFAASSLSAGLRGPLDDKALAAVYTVVGEHTGVLVYLPFALLLVVAAIVRFPRTDAWGRAALLSVLGYAGFYAVIFSANYYGGGQTLGNRYFLQMAPAILAMAVLAGVSRRVMTAGALASAVVGVVLLWPFHTDASNAHVYIERTSPLQELLPEESNQTELRYFQCDKQEVTNITACR
jgi:peptidoglycan/LPS O-acetylase OafA/YrhL